MPVLNCNLGFLNGLRWKVQSWKHKCSSFHWMAAETWQTVYNLKGSCIMKQCGFNVLCLLQKRELKTTNDQTLGLSKKRRAQICTSYHIIKGMWGISWLRRVRHQIQGNLSQDRCTAVFGKQCVDVLHNSRVQIYQFYISTSQTTPHGRHKRLTSLMDTDQINLPQKKESSLFTSVIW